LANQTIHQLLVQSEFNDFCKFQLCAASLFTTSASFPRESRELAVREKDIYSRMLFRYVVDKVGLANSSHIIPKYQKIFANLQEMADLIVGKVLPV
jgi:hypothetical protein